MTAATCGNTTALTEEDSQQQKREDEYSQQMMMTVEKHTHVHNVDDDMMVEDEGHVTAIDTSKNHHDDEYNDIIDVDVNREKDTEIQSKVMMNLSVDEFGKLNEQLLALKGEVYERTAREKQLKALLEKKDEVAASANSTSSSVTRLKKELQTSKLAVLKLRNAKQNLFAEVGQLKRKLKEMEQSNVSTCTEVSLREDIERLQKERDQIAADLDFEKSLKMALVVEPVETSENGNKTRTLMKTCSKCNSEIFKGHSDSRRSSLLSSTEVSDDGLSKSETELSDVEVTRDVMMKRHQELELNVKKANDALATVKEELNVALRRCEQLEADRISDAEIANETDTSIRRKLAWTENKLAQELETTLSAVERASVAERRIKQVTEERLQIQKDYEKAIQSVETTEDLHSSVMDARMQEKGIMIEQHRAEISCLHEEVESLNKRHAELLVTVQKAEKNAEVLEIHSKTVEDELESAKISMKSMSDAQVDLTKRNLALTQASMRSRSVEKDHIEEINRLNGNVALLEAEKIVDKRVISDLEITLQHLHDRINEAGIETERLNLELIAVTKTQKQDQAEMRAEVTYLTSQLNEEMQQSLVLQTELEDERSERHAMDKKSSLLLKDLKRQLKQERRNACSGSAGESIGGSRSGSVSNVHEEKRQSMGNTSSNGHRLTSVNGPHELLNLLLDVPNGGQEGSSSSQQQISRSSSNGILIPSVEATPDIPRDVNSLSSSRVNVIVPCNQDILTLDDDNKMLLRRVSAMQKEIRKKDERIRFFESNTSELIHDIQRKSHLLQRYMLRENLGSLAPESSDKEKEQISLAKRKGIMSSLFTKSIQDSSLTPELLLHMNNQLQKVLEDTLYKNIQLQENIETLGTEIARLQTHM